MRTRVVVLLRPTSTEAWAEQQTADIKEAQDGLAEQREARAADQDAGEVTPEEREEDHEGGEEPSAAAR